MFKSIKKRLKKLWSKFRIRKWLFLDDNRDAPPHLNRVFDVVRSYDEFVEFIETYGVPELISFDHDLSPEHTAYFFENGGFKNPPDPVHQLFQTKTGYDCAVWLIEYCEVEGKKISKVLVHSHNPVGSKNILNLISQYQESKYGEVNCRIVKWRYKF